MRKEYMMNAMLPRRTRASAAVVAGALASAIALTAVTVAVAATAPPTPDDEPARRIVRAVDWLRGDEAPPVEGLYALEVGSSTMTMRMLAETGEGGAVERFVITKRLDAARGEERTTVRHDGGSWSASSVLDFGFRAPTLGAFFDRAGELLVQDTEHRLRAALSVSHGIGAGTDARAEDTEAEDGRFEAAVEIGGEASPLEIAEALASRGQEESGWQHAVPVALRPGLRFLVESMSPEPLPALEDDDNIAYALRLPLEALSALGAFDPERDREAQEPDDLAPMRVGPPRRGATLVDPALLAVAARFESVETTDPFRDRPR